MVSVSFTSFFNDSQFDPYLDQMGCLNHQLVKDEGIENDPHFFPYRLGLVLYPIFFRHISGGELAGFCEEKTSFLAAGGNKYLKSLGLAACHINATWM